MGRHYATGGGLALGDPSGLTLKHFFDDSSAIDVLAGAGFEFDSLALTLGYLYHFGTAQEQPRVRTKGIGDTPRYVAKSQKITAFYLGLGGKLQMHLSDDETGAFAAGLRVPLGVSVFVKLMLFEVFVEAAPGMLLTPERRIDFDVNLGIRVYL